MSTVRHFQQSLTQRVFLALLLGLLLPCNGSVSAQDAAIQISSREAWVGSPIVLQIQIRNAKKYSLPEDFNIDGCDVRRAGNPSCLLYTSPSPRDGLLSRMPSSA